MDDAGFLDDSGQFFEAPAESWLMGFSGRPEFAKYKIGSIVPVFKDGKKAQGTKEQNQPGYAEEGREVPNPAPATLFLLGTGLIGLAAFRRKRPNRT